MTEAWRSVPRKFCSLCKCWFYDNKASIQHHERGVRHQENVRNKIREIGKKGKEFASGIIETRKALQQMERGALQSYRDDLKHQPEVVSSYNIHLNILPSSGRKQSSSPSDFPMKQPHLNFKPGISTLWREVIEPETQTSYYWNSSTNETSWEKPADGYLSITEQQIAFEMDNPDLTAASSTENATTPATTECSADETETEPEIVKTIKRPRSDEGVALKTNDEVADEPAATTTNVESESSSVTLDSSAIGKWTVVSETPKKQVDVLPFDVKDKDAKKFKFEEKKAPVSSKGSKSSSTPITFKKSKSNTSRNLRSRDD